jgi:SAM-dependent methyltransferase
LEYFSSDRSFAYLHCPQCQALSISPVPRENLELIYPTNYYAFDSSSRSVMETVKGFLDQRRLRKLLRQIPGDQLNALDVGGGSGWMLDTIRRADPRVSQTTVVDTSATAVASARKNGHEAFCGPLESFPNSSRFDLILLLNLIEHVEEPASLIAHARTRLKPSGRILIKTPNVDCWEARLLRHRNWGAYHCPRHWVLFTPASLSALLDRGGLQVQSLQLTQGATFWASTVLMALQQRGWIRLGPQRAAAQHPLHGPLCAFFAAFDLVRSLFVRTSQMFVVVKHKGNWPAATASC